MKSLSIPRLADAWRHAAALLAAALLAACGGSVSPSTVVTDPLRITILPASATLYSGLPTTFQLSGGTGSYIVASDNQAVVPVSGNVTSKSFTVIPNPVLADTTVTITVRDTGLTPVATATVTVKPGTVSNTVTITPSSTQSALCSPAICSSGDAEVKVTISQGGVPLGARGVRFEVVSGDFRFITTPPGTTPEVLDLWVKVDTDERGEARTRIRVLPLVPNQTALLKIIDLGSNAYQFASFPIAQFTGNAQAFFTVPQSITFTGPRTGACASNASAQFAIFGGVPPYSIVNTFGSLAVSPLLVAQSGGTFTLTALAPTCVENAPIAITDSTGRTITATVTNQEGTEDATTVLVSPTTVTLTTCTGAASVLAAGGTGSYVGIAGSNAIVVTTSGNVITIRRAAGPAIPANPAPPPAFLQATVGVTDTLTTATVTVNFEGLAAGPCP